MTAADMGDPHGAAAPVGIPDSADRPEDEAGSFAAGKASSAASDSSLNGDVPVPWWYTPKRLLVRRPDVPSRRGCCCRRPQKHALEQLHPRLWSVVRRDTSAPMPAETMARTAAD